MNRSYEIVTPTALDQGEIDQIVSIFEANTTIVQQGGQDITTRDEGGKFHYLILVELASLGGDKNNNLCEGIRSLRRVVTIKSWCDN